MSVDECQAPAGLRERKKVATRQALAFAAMRLAVERGLDNVLVEDIAAAAGVSPRTFNNYFASKYEAICALTLDRSRRVGEALAARPPSEGLWEAIRSAALEVYPDGRPHLAVSGIRLVTRSPELRGEYLKALGIMQYDLAYAITARIGGTPPETAYLARGLAGAVVAAIQAATERWVECDPPASMNALVADALDELSAGMRAILGADHQSADNQSADNQERPPC